MPSNDDTIPLAEKLKALRQIQFVLGQKEHPLARACGLTRDELVVLANEQLIEVTFSRDDGPDLDRYHIEKILPQGFAILAQAYVADPDPLRVSVESPKKSIWSRFFRGTAKGLWEIVKLALAAFFGGVVSWYLTKHLK